MTNENKTFSTWLMTVGFVAGLATVIGVGIELFKHFGVGS